MVLLDFEPFFIRIFTHDVTVFFPGNPSVIFFSMKHLCIRANHRCKLNLIRPKTQRFFQFWELEAEFDFVNIHKVNPNSFFLKNSDLKPDLIVINLEKQMSLTQFQFPSGFKC